MAFANHYANIMLDLECTSVEAPNPAIIELAAVHFDSDTGAELGSLKTPINLKSCLDKGLVTDEGAEGDCTWNWLHHNIPETLIRSQETSVSLEQALFKLSQFVRKSCATWEERQQSLGNPVRKSVQPIIWGNGAVADNIWIRSAYQACGMERPWRFTSDICVRTAMHLVQSMSGRNFKYGEQFEGNAHDALDDCRHQIKYLVKAVNYIKEGERLRRSAKSLEDRRDELIHELEMMTAEKNELEDRLSVVHLVSEESSQAERPPRTSDGFTTEQSNIRPKLGLLSPASSFSMPNEDIEQPNSESQETAVILLEDLSLHRSPIPESRAPIKISSPSPEVKESEASIKAEIASCYRRLHLLRKSSRPADQVSSLARKNDPEPADLNPNNGSPVQRRHYDHKPTRRQLSTPDTSSSGAPIPLDVSFAGSRDSKNISLSGGMEELLTQINSVSYEEHNAAFVARETTPCQLHENQTLPIGPLHKADQTLSLTAGPSSMAEKKGLIALELWFPDQAGEDNVPPPVEGEQIPESLTPIACLSLNSPYEMDKKRCF